jgi:hypothetical protein
MNVSFGCKSVYYYKCDSQPGFSVYVENVYDIQFRLNNAMFNIM